MRARDSQPERIGRLLPVLADNGGGEFGVAGDTGFKAHAVVVEEVGEIFKSACDRGDDGIA